jgi:hypothetical protein
MTPKEKAKELFDKFCNVEIYISIEPKDIECQIKNINSYLRTAKQCALIAVDYIEEALQSHNIHIGYWKEVEKELEKL